MSLGSLHNPRAAAELIGKFRKRFSAKICMAPHTDHSGQIVSAHTLSVGSMLHAVNRDSHVYSLNPRGDLTGTIPPFTLELLGLRAVSVFNGFCSKHDVDLFSCIENRPFTSDVDQLFMLAYRAVAHECYLKRKSYESMPTPDQIREIHGITESLTYSEEELIWQASTLRGAEELEALKQEFDQHLLNERWDILESVSLHFSQTPTIVGSFAFEPFYDLDGEELQEYMDIEADMSHLVLSIIPLNKGGLAIFSWLRSSNEAPRQFTESILRSEKATSAVIHALIDNSETFAISPSWYESLPDISREYLQSRVRIVESSIRYSDQPRPERTAPFLDDWGLTSVTRKPQA